MTPQVIDSGPNDHVFVNFADHGGPGLIAFPRDVLHVAQLNKTIWKMHEEQRYHKMVSDEYNTQQNHLEVNEE